MKTVKKLLFVFVLFGLVNIAGFAQEEQEQIDRKYTIQTSPGSYLIDLINLGVSDDGSGIFMMDLEGQYKTNKSVNLSLTLSFLVDTYGDATSFQINFKPMFVYRPFKTGLKGFYVGAYPNIGWHKENSLWTEIGIGINTGYKWIFANGFTIQLGTGIGKTWGIPEMPDNFGGISSDWRFHLPNFDMHIIDFKLGYSF